MNVIREHINRVRAVEQTLPDYLWVVSLEDPRRGFVGGRFAHVSGETAARLIVDGSHRVASDEEAAEQEAEQARQQHEARKSHVPTFVVTGEPLVLGPKKKGNPR